MMGALTNICPFLCQHRDYAPRHHSIFLSPKSSYPARLLICAFLLLLVAPFLDTSNLNDVDSSPPNLAKPQHSVVGNTWNNSGTSRNSTRPNSDVAKRTEEGGKRGGEALLSTWRPTTRKRPPSCSQTCASHVNITCQVTKRSTMCIHRDQSAVDFPDSPRDLKVSSEVEDDVVSFNVTWKAPYDSSYKAVTGYELHVSLFDYTSSLPSSMYCYFVNLSSTDWTTVSRVHDVVYYLDCVKMQVSRFRKMHIMIFSYPKLAGNHQEKALDLWVDADAVTKPTAADAWVPSITPAQHLESKSLIVQVKPAVAAIDHLKICITKAGSMRCSGNVSMLESPKDMYKFRVEGLTANLSYYIYVKAFDQFQRDLSSWFHKKEPIFLKPWPKDRTTTPRPAEPYSVSYQPPRQPVVEERVGLDMLVALVFLSLLLLLLVAVFVLWRKGYLQTVGFLKVCFPHPGPNGPVIKVLQLYATESEAFQRVVRKHLQYLSQFLHLDVQDCAEMRQQHDPELWLREMAADRSVLVYLSPQLTAMLLQHDRLDRHNDLQSNSPVSVCAGLIHRLASAPTAGSCRKRKQGPILVLSGCFPKDAEDEACLRQHHVLKSLQRFWICQSITDPRPLLSSLSGSHQRFFPSRNTYGAQDLTDAIVALRQNHSETGHYMHDMGLNGSVGRGDPYFNTVDETRVVLLPQRTDSGFSSSVTDHQNGGCNSSWEHNPSQMAPNDYGCERDPMIGQLPRVLIQRSVSQSSLFLPPQSDVGDLDSVHMFEEFRMLNARGDWAN